MTTAQSAAIPQFDFVVFGGTGDLARRKLLPSLYQRDRDGQLPDGSRILALSRHALTDAAWQDGVRTALRQHVEAARFDDATVARFIGRMDYLVVDALGDDGWTALSQWLDNAPDRVRVFYLATAPALFGAIAERLGRHRLITPQSRVVVEKPIGHDLASAKHINDALNQVFSEAQIFRIDHYLGKETVQNLLALRFANALFEPVWNARAIDHVQITVAEKLGVEGRGAYYDQSGALRDMVQNHLLQLLCLVAMEPPQRLEADAVRDEKLKVLRALTPITAANAGERTVRGQYRPGAIDGAAVIGYQNEPSVAPDSTTETFVALKLGVENWRWAGVPFYLRTGKRLPAKLSEIVIQFRPVPHSIFPGDAGRLQANRLVIRLQPDERVQLNLMAKEPGPGGVRLKPAPLNLSFAETFKNRFPDAYERLLMDTVRGNATLFMRRDEVETAWRWTEGVLQAWAGSDHGPTPYIAGSWGPNPSIALIERDGRAWAEDQALAS